MKFLLLGNNDLGIGLFNEYKSLIKGEKALERTKLTGNSGYG